ncbi:unnamed protein product, partial [Choristocarpus tenellus]
QGDEADFFPATGESACLSLQMSLSQTPSRGGDTSQVSVTTPPCPRVHSRQSSSHGSQSAGSGVGESRERSRERRSSDEYLPLHLALSFTQASQSMEGSDGDCRILRDQGSLG